MSTVEETVSILRNRVFLIKRTQAMRKIAPEIGIDHTILRRFLRGESVRYADLLKLEAWCERKENEAQHATTV